MSINRLDYIIQSAIPAVYEDSLSYYELLSKVIAKVNELTDSTNDFLSIDIQKYIVDKLTAWKDDGTLDTIINDTVFNELDTRLDSVEHKTAYVVHLKEEAGYDKTGVTSSSAALTSALSKGDIVQLEDNATVLLDTSVSLSYKVIQGMGRDSVLKLGADITLFDIISSSVVLRNLRILVPAANTKPVLKITPTTQQTFKYIEFDRVWVEGLAVNGSWTGLQIDMSNGFLLYKSQFDVSVMYPDKGIHLIGNGGVTGCDFDVEISGFNDGINISGSDSVQNNRFKGEIQHQRATNSTGVRVNRGWGNRFDLNCWYDSETGQFTDYRFEAPSYNNRVFGHMEGRYVDLGSNLFQATLYKWDFSVTPRSQAGTGDFRDVFDNTQPAPVNLLSNTGFTMGISAGWTPFAGRVTLERDAGTFGYPVMKLKSTSSTIGSASQAVKNFEKLRGKTVYLGCWVFVSSTSVGNRVSGISIQDGVNVSYSELVPKDAGWHWVTVKHNVSQDATTLMAELGRVNPDLGYTSALDDVVYFSDPVMVVGGKLRPHQGYPTQRLLRYTPTSSNDFGKEGDRAMDDNYLYVWTSDNVVKRVGLSTF